MFNQEFAKAIATNPHTNTSLEIVAEKLSDDKFDLFAMNQNNENYLHLACKYSDIIVVNKLLNTFNSIPMKQDVLSPRLQQAKVKTALHALLIAKSKFEQTPFEIVFEDRQGDERLKLLKYILRYITDEDFAKTLLLNQDYTKPIYSSLPIWIYKNEAADVLAQVLISATLPLHLRTLFIVKKYVISGDYDYDDKQKQLCLADIDVDSWVLRSAQGKSLEQIKDNRMRIKRVIELFNAEKFEELKAFSELVENGKDEKRLNWGTAVHHFKQKIFGNANPVVEEAKATRYQPEL